MVWQTSHTLEGLRFGPLFTDFVRQSAQNILPQCRQWCCNGSQVFINILELLTKHSYNIFTKITHLVAYLSPSDREDLFTVTAILHILLMLPPDLCLWSSDFFQLDLKMRLDGKGFCWFWLHNDKSQSSNFGNTLLFPLTTWPTCSDCFPTCSECFLTSYPTCCDCFP